MSFFSFFSSESNTDPLVWKHWGRFSDAYKRKDQYEAWDEAQISFSEGNWTDALTHMMVFLENETGDNIMKTSETGMHTYLLLQGSTQAKLCLEEDHFRAEVNLVRGGNWPMALLRKLLEANYRLKYSRYALAEDTIQLVFDTVVDDLDAYKMYYALRELSLHADSHDDLIAHDWVGIELTDVDHLKKLTKAQRDILIDFAQERLLELGELLDPASQREEVERASLVMCELFTLDYISCPQGRFAEWIVDVLNDYIQQDITQEEANRHAWEHMKRWNSLKDHNWEKEFYSFTSTFGDLEACSLESVNRLIEAEWSTLNWYLKQANSESGLRYGMYIIGKILYSYAPPLWVRYLFDISYQLALPQVFQAFGYEELLNSKGVIHKKRLRRRLSEVMSHFPGDLDEEELFEKTDDWQVPVDFVVGVLDFLRTYESSDSPQSRRV